MWQWMTGGGGATISSGRYNKDKEDGEDNAADVPVTLSLPSRKTSERDRLISVRVKSNPRVDLLLVKSSTSSASSGQWALSEQIQSGTQTESQFSFASENFECAEEVGVESSDQARRLSKIKMFVSVPASAFSQPSSQRTAENRVQSTTECRGAEKNCVDSGDTAFEELTSMLRECACQRSGKWSLADISDIISEALQFDSSRSRSNTGDGVSPCQSARVLILLQSILLCEEGGKGIPGFVEAGIDALLAGWAEQEAEGGADGSGEQGESHFLYAQFIRSKASFLSTRMDTFTGDFSIAGFLRRLDIESVDSERHSKNSRAKSQLFSGETMRRIAELITKLSDVLFAMLAQTTEAQDAGSSPQASGDATTDEASARSSLDAASRELVLYMLTLEAFCACSAIEKLAQNEACQADLAASQESVFKIVEVCQMVRHLNGPFTSSTTDAEDARAPQQHETLLSQALLPAVDGIYRFDESGIALFGEKRIISFSSCIGKHVPGESLKTQGGSASSKEVQDLSKQEHEDSSAGRRVSQIQQTRPNREIDCTFTTIAALHSAFSREIRRVAGSEVQ